MELTTEISRFKYEDMCTRNRSVFPISTVCNAKCLFCSNKMNPFKVHNCGFRPLREVQEYVFKILPLLESDIPICLGDAIPGRISEGEAILHPKFFEILRLIRAAAPQRTIHIATNGALLTEEMIGRIAEYKPFHVMMSYHSVDVDKWIGMFRTLNEKHFDTATRAWRLLGEAGISTSGAIVAMPNVLGYEDIAQTLLFMNQYSPSTIQLWEPGYNKYTDGELLEMMKVHKTQFKEFVYRMYKECDNTALLWNKDPDIPLELYPYHHMLQSVHRGYKNVYWLTGECAYERLRDMIDTFSAYVPNKHTVKRVVNHTYGGNIDCNGLLMINDLQLAVREIEKPDLVIVPDIMLDNLGNDLTEVNYQTLTHNNSPAFWWRST